MTELPAIMVYAALALMLVGLETYRRKTVRLERKLRERNESVALLRRALLELESLESETLSRISGPMKKILKSVKQTMLEISRCEGTPQDARERLSKLTAMIGEIEKFLEVMDELDEIGEEKTGKENGDGEPYVLLDELLFQTLEEWNERFFEKGISLALAVNENVKVRGGGNYLKMVLDNVYSEFLRSMRSDSLVHVVLVNKEGNARLSMTGRGSTDAEFEPSTLGIELARRIVGIYGGWLSFDDSSNSYTMELPLARNDETGDEK